MTRKNTYWASTVTDDGTEIPDLSPNGMFRFSGKTLNGAACHLVAEPFSPQSYAVRRALDDYFNRARILGISKEDAKTVLDFRMKEQAAKRSMTTRDALEQASRDLAHISPLNIGRIADSHNREAQL